MKEIKMNNYDPRLVIEYGSWFECIKLSGFLEPILSQEIDKRIDLHFNHLITVGIQNQNKQQVKVNALQIMQLEKNRNEGRLDFLKKNNVLNAFEHLIPLGEIHNRIIFGVIQKLKNLN